MATAGPVSADGTNSPNAVALFWRSFFPQRVSIGASGIFRMTSIEGASTSQTNKKTIGHRGIDPTGETTYKKTPSSALKGAIQLGIAHTVGSLSQKPERDVLMQDFEVVESFFFPSEGSNLTPAHHHGDFRFKTYAPIAFRYFRDMFGIRPDDYLFSLCIDPLIELSNPGASGSLFYVSSDDEFIIKTVQHKEAEFLQKLLPGYFMNLNQNKRTLLPKFYGLYCIQAAGKNIRIVVMNNLLPRAVPMHLKYDLKGSTYKRRASPKERTKPVPTYKDLDFIQDLSEGLVMESDHYSALCKTIHRDCLVLQSFKIMDYSLLLGIHFLDKAKDEASVPVPEQRRAQSQKPLYCTTLEAIQAEPKNTTTLQPSESLGGIPARNAKGERLLIFTGIIDILQAYRLAKKLEHSWKALVYDGDSVSVHRPDFYSDRFQRFMCNTVFRKMALVKTSPSKRIRGAPFSGGQKSSTTVIEQSQQTQPPSATTTAGPTNPEKHQPSEDTVQPSTNGAPSTTSQAELISDENKRSCPDLLMMLLAKADNMSSSAGTKLSGTKSTQSLENSPSVENSLSVRAISLHEDIPKSSSCY